MTSRGLAAAPPRCLIDGEIVLLGRTLAELLAILLLHHPSRLLSTSFLIECMWPDPESEPRWPESAIHCFLWRLRQKGVAIENNHTRGYRIPLEARD